MKRLLAFMLSAIMVLGVFSLVACGGKETPDAPAVAEYTITFNYGDGVGTVSDKKVKDNEEIGELPRPSIVPQGKTFEGWQTEDGAPIAEDTKYTFGKNITIIARYDAIIYNISYDAKGGTLDADVIRSYSISDSDIALPVPNKLGYTFLGWKANAEATPVKNITAGTIGTLALVAEWQANSYKINFHYGDGAGDLTEKTVKQDETVDDLPTPSVLPTGQKFVGWTKQDNTPITQGTPYTFADDIDVYAVYSNEDYYIGYDTNGGALPQNTVMSYNISETDIPLPTPERKGYTFSGWKTVNDSIITVITAGTCENLDLTATWQPNRYTITFVYGSGDGTEKTRNVDYDQVISNLPVPSTLPMGKEFKGWQTEQGSAFEENTLYKFEENISLIAVYDFVHYSIEYDVQGGTQGANAISYYIYSETDTALPVPTKSGHIFLGWQDGDNIIKKLAAYTMENKNLIAVWTDHFTVYFDNSSSQPFTAWADGTTGAKTIEVRVGGTVVIPETEWDTLSTDAQSAYDYIFSGWYYKDKDNAEKRITGDTVFSVENMNVDGFGISAYVKVSLQWAGPY